MPHFRQEGKGGLCATGRGIRWLSRDTCSQRGFAGFAGMGRARVAVGVACKTGGVRTRRPPHPFPPNPAKQPRWAWVCAATAHDSGLHRLAVQAETSAYTRPPSQEASAGVLVCERDLPLEVYQENVPAHIPQKGLIKPRSCLEAVRWENIPVIQLLGAKGSEK